MKRSDVQLTLGFVWVLFTTLAVFTGYFQRHLIVAQGLMPLVGLGIGAWTLASMWVGWVVSSSEPR
jgi:hypothetical protein